MTLENTTVADGVPHLDIDPFSPEVRQEPYIFYEALREAGPVVWLPRYGTYAVGRYDEVQKVIRDFERFTATGAMTSAAVVALADAALAKRVPGSDAESGLEFKEAFSRLFGVLFHERSNAETLACQTSYRAQQRSRSRSSREQPDIQGWF